MQIRNEYQNNYGNTFVQLFTIWLINRANNFSWMYFSVQTHLSPLLKQREIIWCQISSCSSVCKSKMYLLEIGTSLSLITSHWWVTSIENCGHRICYSDGQNALVLHRTVFGMRFIKEFMVCRFGWWDRKFNGQDGRLADRLLFILRCYFPFSISSETDGDKVKIIFCQYDRQEHT